jgi:hypothetical protein
VRRAPLVRVKWSAIRARGSFDGAEDAAHIRPRPGPWPAPAQARKRSALHQLGKGKQPMKKSVAGLFAAVATLAFASTAQAQICAGYPSSDRGFYFGARADFPEDINSYGVEANYNFSGPLGVYAGLNVLSDDDEVEGAENDSEDELFAGVAFEVASLGLMIGPRVSVCPVAELRNISFGDDLSYTEVPVGLGVGASLGIPGIRAAGYVQPQVVFSRFKVQDESESDTNFGIKGGAMFGLGLVTVGGEVRHMFLSDDAVSIRDETTFGIRVGIAF